MIGYLLQLACERKKKYVRYVDNVYVAKCIYNCMGFSVLKKNVNLMSSTVFTLSERLKAMLGPYIYD